MNVKITGPAFIKGSVTASGSKNAAIPIICAALLAKGKVLLRNVPQISDVDKLVSILKKLNCKVIFKNTTMLIDSSNLTYQPLLFEECKMFRGSYYLIGVFLTLFSQCEILLPGGCKIGSRPIDVHLQAFFDLGFEHEISEDILYITKKKEHKNVELKLTKKSVGATINALLAGLNIDGFTMTNGLFEPEGSDVLTFLKELGYDLNFSGETLVYHGKQQKYEMVKHTLICDRIEALSYVVMGLLLGEIRVTKVDTNILATPLKILKEAGFDLDYTENEIIARQSTGSPFEVVTQTYPGFPTDLQPIFGVLATNTTGVSEIEETIFENRMHIYHDLIKCGVECRFNGNNVKIKGTKAILNKDYKAFDLRHGFAVLLLGLMSKGQSTISNFEYVLRGYDNLHNKLTALGANIEEIA